MHKSKRSGGDSQELGIKCRSESVCVSDCGGQ